MQSCVCVCLSTPVPGVPASGVGSAFETRASLAGSKRVASKTLVEFQVRYIQSNEVDTKGADVCEVHGS